MTKEQKQVISKQIIMLTKDDVREITGWREKYCRPYISVMTNNSLRF